MISKYSLYIKLILIFTCVPTIKLFPQFSPASNYVSREKTVNGYGNFFLGTDFAEPYVATNPTDPKNSVCSFIMGSYYTLDGLNWTRIPGLTSSDPFLAFDGNGNVYYSPKVGVGFGIYTIAKSTDKGVSWPNSYLVFNGNVDKMCMCTVPYGGPYANNVYAGWQFYVDPTLNLYFSRSTNNGVNWSTTILNQSLSDFYTYMAIGPYNNIQGGMIYYGFSRYNDLTNDISVVLRRSSDGGINFSPATVAFTVPIVGGLKQDSVQNTVGIQMAADNGYGPYRGNVYIVISSKFSPNDSCDIVFSKSTNYGANWSAPVRLNDDNTNTDQWLPALAVDNNGRIYATWYDSRIDPQNNKMTLLYGTLSTNGGASFYPDIPISNTPFNPVKIVKPFGGANFMGHYNGVSAIGNTALASWTDGRYGDFGSFVGYFPDFAFTVNPDTAYLGSNDSLTALIKLPASKGPFFEHVKFTVSVDSIPAQGNFTFMFIGKDSIVSIPDSVYLKIKLTNINQPGKYKVSIVGRCTGTGVPVHSRDIELMVNSSFLNIGTNRNGSVQYKVNENTYNQRQSLVFPNGTAVNIRALSPFNISSQYRYTYEHWSDNGDTSHIISLNTNTFLTAIYKTQFKFTLESDAGNAFGGNIFCDSSSNTNFGVMSKTVIYNGQVYHFRGWDGFGFGSYTSPDSSGNDTSVVMNIFSQVLERARWAGTVGIRNLETEIPKENKLFQNYPNPFNPSANIRYQITKNSFVTLKIFDILGREVITLINENLKAGKYEVAFDGSKLSSGIYFYKLTADNFTDIKRMVLIK